jgi:hypothetical protein
MSRKDFGKGERMEQERVLQERIRWWWPLWWWQTRKKEGVVVVKRSVVVR